MAGLVGSWKHVVSREQELTGASILYSPRKNIYLNQEIYMQDLWQEFLETRRREKNGTVSERQSVSR